jgi:hypothetical protein
MIVFVIYRLLFATASSECLALQLPHSRQENSMPRFLNTALLATALVTPIAFAPIALRADDRTYHDKQHNDEHHWDSHEDRAYRIRVKENHRKYRDFSKLRDEDRESYWSWRHQHSDAELKINIR